MMNWSLLLIERIINEKYRDGPPLSNHSWGKKESYDICLDSDVLSREKCAEILIEAASDCKVDLNRCAEIIKNSFEWTK